MSDKFFGIRLPEGKKRGGIVQTAGIVYQSWKEAEATVGDDDGVGTFKLKANTQRVDKGISALSCARQLKINSNKATITSSNKVKILGTNIHDENISEEISLNGTTAVTSTKAFKKIKAIELPVQVNTPVKQVHTITVAGGAGTASGTVTTTITSANLTGSPVSVETEVEKDDTKAIVAQKIADALNADEEVSKIFVATTDDDDVIITNIDYLADDSTLAMAIADTDSTGVGATASGTDTTAGVEEDAIIVGYTEKLGLKVSARAVHNIASYKDDTTDGSVSFTCDADEVEKNMIKFNASLGTGTRDTCYLVRE